MITKNFRYDHTCYWRTSNDSLKLEEMMDSKSIWMLKVTENPIAPKVPMGSHDNVIDCKSCSSCGFRDFGDEVEYTRDEEEIEEHEYQMIDEE